MAKGIKVEAIKPHTYNGKSYDVGDTYEFVPIDSPGNISADDQVASLQTTGFAVRVDRVQVAKEQAAAAEKSAKARSKAVAPMTTDNSGLADAAPRSGRGAKAPKAPRAAKVAKARKG